MKKIIILLVIPLLFSCQSKTVLGKYESSCYSIDSPSTILNLQKNNRFILIYPSSVEKVIGNWKTNQDTLILNSQFSVSLTDRDSTTYKKKYFFLVKSKKLINLENKKCFMKLTKQFIK
ncbi:hypothetical protein AB4Y90_11410 [Chryseobacterium sp. 2TAF14]|uniref:hypothetical protein n=1 Tax=Chryseobacterium sp. 2TAF14 TaxID=3233007 RepID=UPI003F8EEF03